MFSGPAKLAIQHRPVLRNVPVSRELLGRLRPRAVHVVGDTDRERATTRTTRCGRSAASAASRTVGPTYSANGFGPVIQVIVPAGHRPASRNPCGPSAAR
jgi:hypothetical protein